MESRPAFCIFCDDVREEVGGKVSMMGTYGSELIVNAPFPYQAPKFCINVYVISAIEDPPKSLRIRVTYPARQVIFEAEMSDGLNQDIAADDATKAHYVGRLQVSPMVFSEPGDLEVFVETERETSRAGRLRIRAADSP